MARAASRWPPGSEATPARMISAMMTQLYAVRPMTRNHRPDPPGIPVRSTPSSGRTRLAK